MLQKKELEDIIKINVQTTRRKRGERRDWLTLRELRCVGKSRMKDEVENDVEDVEDVADDEAEEDTVE